MINSKETNNHDFQNCSLAGDTECSTLKLDKIPCASPTKVITAHKSLFCF